MSCNEFSDALDWLVELEVGCEEAGVPRDRIEELLARAHYLISKRQHLDEVYKKMDTICDLWIEFEREEDQERG